MLIIHLSGLHCARASCSLPELLFSPGEGPRSWHFIVGSRNTKINPSTLGISFPAPLWSSFQQSKQLLVAGEICPRDAEIAVAELGRGSICSEENVGREILEKWWLLPPSTPPFLHLPGISEYPELEAPASAKSRSWPCTATPKSHPSRSFCAASLSCFCS